MSSENQTPHQVSRRAVVGAAVWAVPVIAISTATPAFAAGSGTQVTSSTAIKIVADLGVWGGNINFTTLQVVYDANNAAFPGVPSYETPAVATVTWRIVVKDSSGNVVATPYERVDEVTRYSYKSIEKQPITGLPKGTYTVLSEIILVTYTENPYNGFQFYTGPSTSTQTVTIS